jgi:hypothetical protein
MCLCWRVLSVLLTICLKVSGSLYQFLRQLKGRGATRLKRLPLPELCSNFLAAELTSNNMGLPKSTRPMRILPLHFAFRHHEDEFGAFEFDASPDSLLPNRDQREVIELIQKNPCAAQVNSNMLWYQKREKLVAEVFVSRHESC